MAFHRARLFLMVLPAAVCTNVSEDDATGYARLDAQLSYVVEVDGEERCDLEIQLEGTPYTGDCEGCTFAFAIDARVVESAGDCDVDPLTSWLAGSFMRAGQTYSAEDMVMAHSDRYGGHDDVLLSGYHLTWSQETGDQAYPDRYWAPIAYAGSSYGAFISDGDDFTLSWLSFDAAEYRYSYLDTYNMCMEYTEGAALTDGATTSAGGLPCGEEILDVWSLTVAGETETISISVDTVSESTTFDPMMWVNDVDAGECALAQADDSFDCSYPPPRFSCPSVSFDADSERYQIVVVNLGDCAGDVGEYRIVVDGGAGAGLELLANDTVSYTVGTHEIDVWAVGSLISG